MCAMSVAPLDGFGVFKEELPPFTSTSTSGRGVSGGESAVAVAGVYLSFQYYVDPSEHTCRTLMP